MNFSLDHALERWASLSAVEAEWSEWDAEQQFAFLEGWAVPRSHLEQLRQWHSAGTFDAGQQRRYDRLLDLVRANTPVLDRLFAA